MVKHPAQWPQQVGIELNRLATDQKTVAERQWQKGTVPRKCQEPCDIGLFSDDSKQEEMF